MPGAHVFTWNTPSNNLRWRGAPHGDPRLARMGVRSAGFRDRTFIIDEETEEMLPRIWETPGDIEMGETGVVLGEESIGGIAMTPEAYAWLSLGMTVAECFYILSGALLVGSVAAEMEKKYASKYTTRKDWSNRDTKDVPIRKRPWWGIFDPTTDSDWANPDDAPGEKKQKTDPVVRPRGDFSGLVTTFVDPVTSHIIGFKGIPRKRKFHALLRYSRFWKDHMSTPPSTPMRPPAHLLDTAMRE